MGAGLVYFLTAAAGLTWRHGGDDGGDLATAVALDGVPHPTGYPLFLLAGKLLLFLDVDPARALALTDSLWGALAAGVLSLTVYRLNRYLLADFSNSSANAGGSSFLFEITCLAGGVMAGLGLAFGPLVWSQAIIIEIYSLNLLLLTLLLLALVWWSEKPESRVRFYLLALTGGLAAGHHRTAIFSLLAVAIFIFLTLRLHGKENLKLFTWPRLVTALVIVGLAAGLPALLLPGRGGQTPASNWDNLGWSDPGGLWNYLTGSEYRNLLFAAPVGQDIGRIAATAGLLFQQTGPVGLALGWVGLAVAWLTSARYHPLAWCLSAGLIGHMAFAAVYAADNSQVYLLPFFAFWAVAAGFSLSWSALYGVANWPTYKNWLAIVAMVAALLVPGISLTANYSRLDLHSDRSAEAWARSQLEAAPGRAIVLTGQDNATFAMWYVQYVQRYRPTIIVVETRLLVEDWYRENLARLYPDLKLPATGDNLATLNFDRTIARLTAPTDQTTLP